jgi:hypothetical protein
MTERKPTSPRKAIPWRPPTRRAFVAMLSAAAAAAALAIEDRARGVRVAAADDDRPRSPWTGTTRWIGHC